MTATMICRPGRYRVTITFDTGVEDRVVITEREIDAQGLMLLALFDMRMLQPFPGPGFDGKVQGWTVTKDKEGGPE